MYAHKTKHMYACVCSQNTMVTQKSNESMSLVYWNERPSNAAWKFSRTLESLYPRAAALLPWSGLHPPCLFGVLKLGFMDSFLDLSYPIRPQRVWTRKTNMFPNTNQVTSHSGSITKVSQSDGTWFVAKAGQHNEWRTCILLFAELKSWNIHICGRSEPLAKSKHKSSMIYSWDNTILNILWKPANRSASHMLYQYIGLLGTRFVFA